MAVPKLPKTNIRLATSASLYVLREDAISLLTYFKNIFQPRSETQAILNQMQQLTGIVSFGEDQTRTLESRWEVDSDIRGEPVQVMGSPVTRSLKLRRAVFYANDLITSLGFLEQVKNSSTGLQDGGLLAQQLHTPFIIIKREAAPEGSGIGVVVTFYRRCQIASISISENVESGQNLGVFEDTTFTYAQRQRFTT